MKTNTILLFSLHFSAITVSAQQYSYLFGEAQPKDNKKVENVDARYFGTYTSEDDKRIVFNKEGVFSETPIVASINKETVRESSNYFLRGEYLHGIVENDSVLFIEDNERLFYMIISTIPIISSEVSNELVEESASTYWLNFNENKGCVPSGYRFEGRALIVTHFDYDEETTLLDEVERKEESNEDDLIHVYLFPDKKEWGKIKNANVFWRETRYQKAD